MSVDVTTLPALRESLRDLHDLFEQRNEFAANRGKWRIPVGAYRLCHLCG